MQNYASVGRKKLPNKNYRGDYPVTKNGESKNPSSWYDHSETTSINPANNQGSQSGFEPLDRPTQFPSFFTTFSDITENAHLPNSDGSLYKKSKIETEKKIRVDEQNNYSINKIYSSKRKQRPMKGFKEVSISENKKFAPAYFQPTVFSSKMLPSIRKNYNFSNMATREIFISEHKNKNIINRKKKEENQHPYGSDYLKISDWQIKKENNRENLKYNHRKDPFR